jgi:lantibiotic modifying enzyme
MERARRRDEGSSWTTLPGKPDLAGLSHGASGIALALLELHHVTGDARHLQAAREGFRFERSLFDPRLENWADVRGTEPAFPVAWCHGAPGIGLARLRAYELLREEQWRAEAEAALRTTRRSLEASTPGADFSLCHGVAGNAELFLYAAQVLRDPSLLDVATTAGLWGLELYERPARPWPCGVRAGGENPSLMLGLAGIGWFYLRLHDPHGTPPVTLPPATPHGAHAYAKCTPSAQEGPIPGSLG